jgi:hypothetical protein
MPQPFLWPIIAVRFTALLNATPATSAPIAKRFSARAHSHELNQQDECQLWQILDVGQFNSHLVNSASPAKANNIKKLCTTQISKISCIFLNFAGSAP